MKKEERAAKVQAVLDVYVPSPSIFLVHQDPFTLLVAVLLSAQCTDQRVNQVTPRLFALASTPAQMAKLSLEVIEQTIKSCGLYTTKAAAIQKLSRMLVEHHDSKVPKTLEELTSLPGVGRKTASVVLCQAFQIPAFPVDTHVHRCSKRWKLSSGKNVLQTEKDLRKLFPESSWCKLHLQMITFARLYCPAKKHVVEKCPMCSWV